MKKVARNLLFLIIAIASASHAEQAVELNGIEVMQETYNRHQQYPYVYEEQSIVMRDRNGKLDTRKAHRYSRVEKDGTAKFMLVFDYPLEIKGVAVLATRDSSGKMSKSIYLPAFAEQLIESKGENSYGNFLGTDFSVENIIGERLTEYQYFRRQDRNIDSVQYFVIDVFGPDDDMRSTAPLKRHFVRQDNFFIGQTDHYDNYGRLHKRQSHHDLKAVDGDMWRSGMILIEDMREQHQSLLKITRRKFSHDYVPAGMFTADWLYQNYPYVAPAEAIEENNNEEDENLSVENGEQLSRLGDGGEIQP
jgi:Outer membrane lipoprotein-sorting protein